MSKYPTKIDPITGCRVLTTAGFFMSEADRNGTTPAEEVESFVSDIEREQAIEDRRYRDPAEVKDMINHEIREIRRYMWAEVKMLTRNGHTLDAEDLAMCFIPYVDRILEIDEADAPRIMSRRAETRILAIARRSDGEVDVVEMTGDSYGGSFYEPPSNEVDVRWHSLDPEHNRKECEQCRDTALYAEEYQEEYVGDEGDGCSVRVWEHEGSWCCYVLVDSDTGSFCQMLTRADGFESSLKALAWGLGEAETWCVENGVDFS